MMVAFVAGCAPPADDSPGTEGNPQPTELLVGQREGEEWRRQRQEWIDSLHRAAPGTDWRELEHRNWNAHLEQRNQLRASLTKTGTDIEDGWREVGSGNLAGRTHQAAYDELTDTLYVGSNLGGVWRGFFDADSPDPDLMDWEPVGDSIYGSSMQVILLSGPPEALLKTWGDAWSGEVHRSTDGGSTWHVVPGTVGRPRRMIVTADSAETVFLITDDPNHWSSTSTTRLFRSQDSGASFQMVLDLGAFRADIWTSRTESGPLYLLTDHQLQTSSDLGETWDLIGTLPTTGPARVTLAGSEAGAPRLFAVVELTSGTPVTRLYRSNNGGATWANMGNINDFWGDLTSLAASTVNPNLVLYGGVEAHRSADGGASFQKINNWNAYYSNPARKLHADIPSIDFVPLAGGGEVLFIATDGGTYYSNDGGATVHNISLAGLRISQYYSILTDLGAQDRIMAGSQDQGFQLGDRGTGLFDQLISGDFGQLTSSDGTHDLVYSVYPGFVLAAKDNGTATPNLFWPIDFPNGESYDWLPAVVADPLDHNTFFFCATHIYRYTRSGSSWPRTQLPHDFEIDAGEYVSALAISPSDPSRWYSGTTSGRAWFSTDAGSTWIQSTISGGPGSPWLTGLAILVDEQNPLDVVVGGSGYSNRAAFRSTDGGVSFTSMGNGLPQTTIFALAATPGGGGDLFAATEAGPYRFSVDTQTWVSILQLTAPMTTYWDVETLSDRVRFATYGRGIWDFLMHELSISVVGTGDGAVTSSPSGINCGLDCAQRYGHGTVVELIPEPDPGSTFSRWEGDPECVDGGGVVTMDHDISCTAVFDLLGTVFADGFESGNVSRWSSSTPGI